MYIYLYLYIYITINAVAVGMPWGHHTSEIFRTEIVKTITTSMFYNKILLLVSSVLIFFWKIKKIAMTWNTWRSLCRCLSSFFLLIEDVFIGLV